MTATINDKAVVQCPAGTVLFREGESGSTMFVLKSGRVRLHKRVHDETVVVGELGAGAFCGELSMINDQPRPVTATVLQDASLIKLDAGQFEEMVRKNPDIALRMLKKMGKRLNESQYRVSNFVLRTNEGRLLHQLRHEAEQAGEDDELTGTVPIPDDLAAVLSIDVGELKALLNEFIDRELIAIDSEGHFHIPDPAEFDRYLSYLELKDRYDYSEA